MTSEHLRTHDSRDHGKVGPKQPTLMALIIACSGAVHNAAPHGDAAMLHRMMRRTGFRRVMAARSSSSRTSSSPPTSEEHRRSVSQTH